MRSRILILVHWRIEAIQSGEDLLGGLGPDEAQGVGVVFGDIAL